MKIEIKNGKCIFKGEYNPEWNTPAKNLGGKWSPDQKAWIFDERDIDRVKELSRKIYGTDGSAETGTEKRYTVQIQANDELSFLQQGIYYGGKLLAHATGRDSGAKLSTNIILLSGSFSSGGSVKNWRTSVSKNAIIEIKDFPEGCLLKGQQDTDWIILSVTEQITDRKSQLLKEKESLLKKLSEIEADLLNIE